jgi:hypothetical protein
MTEFRLGIHRLSGEIIVEIIGDDGTLAGSIYPTRNGSNSIHVVSKYFAEVPIVETLAEVPIPGYAIKFRERK